MPVALAALGKKAFKIPPFYLAILGLLLIVFGAGFDVSSFINLGAWFTIAGFYLSFFWNAISEIRSLDKNRS